MTKNFTSLKSPTTEELDLDSFLRRHNAEDDEEEHQHSDIIHRSIDDILNDSSGSDNDVVSVPSSIPYTQTLNSGEKQFNSTQFRSNLIQRIKSDDFSGNSSRKPPAPLHNSRNSSIFSGGVSRKPGAALAAAAAASRNVRTPRAAVIKSRRALSVSLEGKVSDEDELLGFVKDDVKSEGCDGDGTVSEVVGEVIEERENEDECGSGANVEKREVMLYSEKHGVLGLEDLSAEQGIKEREKGVAGFIGGTDELENDVDSGRREELLSSSEKNGVSDFQEMEKMNSVDFAEKGIGYLSDVEEEREGKKRDVDENPIGEGIGVSLEAENEIKEEEDLGFSWQIQESEKSVVVLNGDELGAGSDGLSSAGDDIEGVVEDRIIQLESEVASKRTEEKFHPPKKPLELAEELEIKQASTGQDLEEGAAAQPMRLEGVRRSSTVLGYFDVNADNTITRAIKSQAFTRDYGTPQVIAVHQNFIALGMSKGVTVVVPSKYTGQHPDNMDPKVIAFSSTSQSSFVCVP